MRRAILGLGILGGVAALMGCPVGPPGLCDYGACDPPDGAVLDGGDSGFDAPQGCDLKKEPKDSPACVDFSVGIFVSPSGSDANDGSKEKPVATIAKALSLMGAKPRVYVCEGAYSASVDVAQTAEIYGGFKCDWTYSGTKPSVVASKSAYAIKISQASVVLADMEVQGKSGVLPGESSIGVYVANAPDVRLVRVKVSAGPAGAALDGELKPFSFAAPPSGGDASGTNGGAAIPNPCPAGDTSTGGKGGNGTLVVQFNGGGSGTPDFGAGDGGVGGSSCTNGVDGAPAPGATPGAGATTLGVLSAQSWTPSAGVDGVAGKPGQGGGGGGGKDTGSNQGGGSGGGPGGCGGAGGGGGKGGGASVALVAFSSTVTVVGSELVASDAGAGGVGKAGQPGQAQVGLAGKQVNPGCVGGSGGAGGAGGNGGGGAGGVSAAILYKGTKPTTDSATDGKSAFGKKGNKGIGGSPGTNDGIDGVAQAVLQVQ